MELRSPLRPWLVTAVRARSGAVELSLREQELPDHDHDHDHDQMSRQSKPDRGADPQRPTRGRGGDGEHHRSDDTDERCVARVGRQLFQVRCVR
jgi:hypothetical protein